MSKLRGHNKEGNIIVIRPALLAIMCIASTTGAKADIYSDCNQSADVKRTMSGCTQIIQRGKHESRRNRSFAHTKRGMIYADRQQHQKAISEYTRAIKADPSYADAYNNRGTSYQKIGDFDRAIVEHTKAIKIDPQFGLAYNNRGYAYRKKDQYDFAIADYNKAIQLNSHDTLAYLNRGFAYLQEGQQAKTIADWRKAHSLGDKRATHNLNVMGVKLD